MEVTCPYPLFIMAFAYAVNILNKDKPLHDTYMSSSVFAPKLLGMNASERLSVISNLRQTRLTLRCDSADPWL